MFSREVTSYGLQNSVRIHHALATRAEDYRKRNNVLRLQTADGAEYLLQTSDSIELQQWVDSINLAAASLSSRPLSGAVGSQQRFHRPLLPVSVSKLSVEDQLVDHVRRVEEVSEELETHRSLPPPANAKSRVINDYKEKEMYLVYEILRYRTYIYHLRSHNLNPTANTSPHTVLGLPHHHYMGDDMIDGGDCELVAGEYVIRPGLVSDNMSCSSIGSIPSATGGGGYNNVRHSYKAAIYHQMQNPQPPSHPYPNTTHGYPYTTHGHPHTAHGHPHTTHGHQYTTPTHPYTSRIHPQATSGNPHNSARGYNTVV